MRNIDAIGGMYNIVSRKERTTADYQVPVEKFIELLSDHDVPEELCVVGLGETLRDDEALRSELVETMRQENDFLNGLHPLPKIQFALDGTFQSVGDSFEVELEGQFYPLDTVFGHRLKRREEGWLVSPYRV